MQEERKSCCRIKHLNPFKSIFLLWIGTFAARGMYSRVHISSDTAFLKILKKPSIVQEKMLPHMNLLGFFHTKKQKNIFFEQPNN